MHIVTTHLGADFDALGAAAGTLLLHPEARLVFPGSQEVAVRRFLEKEHIELPEIRVRELRRVAIARATVVDCSSLRRLGEVGELIAAAACPVRVVDHHAETSDLIPGAEVHVEPVAATCTVLSGELRERGVTPDPRTATLMLLGIYEDTGGLTYADTTAADVKAAAWLLECGARLDWVRRYVLRPLEPEQLVLLNQLVEGAVEHRLGGVRVVVTHTRPSERVEEAAYVIHRYAEIFDLPVVVAVLEVPPQLVIIARSTVAAIDAGKLLAPLGGGGHATAAAARVRGRSAVEISEQLLAEITASLGSRWTAGAIATPFLHTCRDTTTVGEAKQRLVRLRVNAMPIEDGKGELVGVVTRQVLDSALAGGLENRPVTSVMGPGVPEIDAAAPVEDLQQMFMENPGRFVVVRLESGRGIVTRMDLFRRLYEHQLTEGARLDRRLAGARLVVHDVGRRIMRSLSAPLADLLRRAGELAQGLGMRAYLVGGAVRDLLLGRDGEDFDVVVEGNGIELAARLAEATGARVHTHEPFMTAVLHLPDGQRLDITTARTEFYRSPAALPLVASSALRQDLYRRDFTINAMAIALSPEHWGDLLDFFGGQRDLDRRQIRVLHSLSFLDDPTRAIRAVRFSTRLGFELAAETAHLVRVAVSEGVFTRLSGERLRDELAELLDEGRAAEALASLQQVGVLGAVMPAVTWTVALRRFLNQVEAVLDWAALEEVLEGPRWPVYLVALATRAGEHGGRTLARRLALSGKLGAMAASARSRIETMLSVLTRENVLPSDVVALVERHERPLVLVTMAAAGEGTRRLLRQALTVWSRVASPVTGAQLRAAGLRPGPAFGQAIKRTRAAVLDGVITPDTAVEHAIALARQLGAGT